jgi:Raf kinase inhibitor-like YbhB/YbcL family protein
MSRIVGPSRPRRVSHPGLRGVALALVATIGLVACGTSGRELRPPQPGATAPTTAAPTTIGPGAIDNAGSSPTTADLFVLSSSAFSSGGTIPATYTCDGNGISPPLSWTNVPAGTVELVLVVADPDAKGFVHWMVAGINPDTTGVAAGATPPGAVVLANGAGTHAYTPMCPPNGQNHSYEFTLYPLTSPSGLTAASETNQAIEDVATKATGTAAVLTGDYQRKSG